MRIVRVRDDDRLVRYAAVATAAGTALMRHFLALAHPPPHLSGGVTMRSPAAALIPRPGSTTRLAPADPRALTRAVNVAVIAAAADPHLRRTTPTVVEPIGRLTQLPQRPLPKHWTALGQGRHKGPAQSPFPGTAHRGLGGSDANLETLGPRFFDLSTASISQTSPHASTRPNHRQDLLPPMATDRATPNIRDRDRRPVGSPR